MDEDGHRSVKSYDRKIGNLEGLPDVVKTRASTVRHLEPLTGESETFIVQTYRQWKRGDTIFIEFISQEQSMRFVIPPAVAKVIARQRDQLTTSSRRALGKQRADELSAAGEAFRFKKAQ